MSTETELSVRLQAQILSNRREGFRPALDSSIPGRAVMLLRTGTIFVGLLVLIEVFLFIASGYLNFQDRHSPPPVDPSEDQSSITTEMMVLEDFENGSKVPLELRKKQRKKVTFDLKPQRSINAEGMEIDCFVLF